MQRIHHRFIKQKDEVICRLDGFERWLLPSAFIIQISRCQPHDDTLGFQHQLKKHCSGVLTFDDVLGLVRDKYLRCRRQQWSKLRNKKRGGQEANGDQP